MGFDKSDICQYDEKKETQYLSPQPEMNRPHLKLKGKDFWDSFEGQVLQGVKQGLMTYETKKKEETAEVKAETPRV